MIGMSRRKLKNLIDSEQVKDAIQKAERQTSGEIRVSVSGYFWGNVNRVAEKAFIRMGMTTTKDRNGILFFIVPSRRRFAVIGDIGIHAKVGQDFWEHLVSAMSENFSKGEFTEGLLRGIEEAGQRLATHFPYDPVGDVNELSDDIDYGQ